MLLLLLLVVVVLAIVIVTTTVECFVKHSHKSAAERGSPTKGKLKRDLCILPQRVYKGRGRGLSEQGSCVAALNAMYKAAKIEFVE